MSDPLDEDRIPPNQVLAHLGVMALVSVVLGIVVAGLAIPFAGVLGFAARDLSDSMRNLPEELAIVDGEIVVSSEAGADDYAPWDQDGRDGAGNDGVNDTGGSEGTDAEDFWAQTHLRGIPLGVLDGPGADGTHGVPMRGSDQSAPWPRAVPLRAATSRPACSAGALLQLRIVISLAPAPTSMSYRFSARS